MKIAVVGSRHFKYKDLVQSIVYKELKIYHMHDWLSGVSSVLISGGAEGVDTWAEEVSDSFLHGVPKIHKHDKLIFKADWDDLSHPDAIIKTNSRGKKYDARAGIRRNKLIVDEADSIIAFWDGKSPGTKSTIDMAIKSGKPVDIYVRS